MFSLKSGCEVPRAISLFTAAFCVTNQTAIFTFLDACSGLLSCKTHYSVLHYLVGAMLRRMHCIHRGPVQVFTGASTGASLKSPFLPARPLVDTESNHLSMKRENRWFEVGVKGVCVCAYV